MNQQLLTKVADWFTNSNQVKYTLYLYAMDHLTDDECIKELGSAYAFGFERYSKQMKDETNE